MSIRVKQTQLDLSILKGIQTTRYLRGRPEVKKSEFLPNHTPVQEAEDAGHDEVDVDAGMGEQEGEAKHRRLTAEVLAFKEL